MYQRFFFWYVDVFTWREKIIFYLTVCGNRYHLFVFLLCKHFVKILSLKFATYQECCKHRKLLMFTLWRGLMFETNGNTIWGFSWLYWFSYFLWAYFILWASHMKFVLVRNANNRAQFNEANQIKYCNRKTLRPRKKHIKFVRLPHWSLLFAYFHENTYNKKE